MKTKDTLTLLRQVQDAIEKIHITCCTLDSVCITIGGYRALLQSLYAIPAIAELIAMVEKPVDEESLLIPVYNAVTHASGDAKEGSSLYHLLPSHRMQISREVIQAIRTHLAPVASGWMDISTAPKDGIRYLGMIVGDRFYGEPFVCYYDEDEGHICLHQTEARLHRPTHWMHFPAPTIPQPPKKD